MASRCFTLLFAKSKSILFDMKRFSATKCNHIKIKENINIMPLRGIEEVCNKLYNTLGKEIDSKSSSKQNECFLEIIFEIFSKQKRRKQNYTKNLF